MSKFSKILFQIRKIEKSFSFLCKVILSLIGVIFLALPYISSFSIDYFPDAWCNSLADVVISIILQLVSFVLIIPWLIPLAPELPDLSDDMEDGLSSDSNMESLKEIMDCLTKLAETGKEVYILSGDIHLGGLTEIIDTRNGDKNSHILQIVSSPISYKPMPKVVAGLTTTSSEMVVRDCAKDKRLFARNIFYLSKRNFAQIFPDREDKAIVFHFEGHKIPTAFPKKFF